MVYLPSLRITAIVFTMTNAVLSSTFFLTLLLMVGLIFFIRAATKERTETLQVTLEGAPETIREKLTQYFYDRAYEPLETTLSENALTLTGNVRPSLFLAVFLSALAAIGAVCFALVLGILFPRYSATFSTLLLIAPIAGTFYWRRARREETVRLEIASTPPLDTGDQTAETQITVVAHRDELNILRRALLTWKKS